MKILIMGLPGSGKTWVAERLQKHLECTWFNDDRVSEMTNDRDSSIEGQMRLADQMKFYADFEMSNDRTVICDFVCPTEDTRKHFDADHVIWMDTIKENLVKNADIVFEKPRLLDVNHYYREYPNESMIKNLANEIKEKLAKLLKEEEL